MSDVTARVLVSCDMSVKTVREKRKISDDTRSDDVTASHVTQ